MGSRLKTTGRPPLADPITRRQFLRGSALIAGAAAVFDPSWLFDGSSADAAAAFGGSQRDRPGQSRFEGPSAQVAYGDGDSAPLLRWTRLGEDHTLDLWFDRVVVDVPSRSATASTIPLNDFARGRGHHEIVRYFGAPALAQLRTEVAYRSVLVRQAR